MSVLPAMGVGNKKKTQKNNLVLTVQTASENQTSAKKLDTDAITNRSDFNPPRIANN